MAEKKQVYLLVDLYSFAVRGAYPSREEAQRASDNTQAVCAIYEVQVRVLGD
jgi:hypothetical protein